MNGVDGQQQHPGTQIEESPKRVTKHNLRELIERQHFRCALTGVELSPATAALDHIVPISKGGQHDMSNVQVLEERVNLAKGTLTNDEFVEMCVLVARNASKVPDAG